MQGAKKVMANTAIMTAVSLLMRTVAVSFNVYLTAKIGSQGIGLFQLIISVYSMAVTFSCAGIRLATTRVAVEITAHSHCSLSKSIRQCVCFALCSGLIFGTLLYFTSDKIALLWLENPLTAAPLRILAFSLPFVAMSNSLGGFFAGVGLISQYSLVQLMEQGFKIAVTIALLKYTVLQNELNAVVAGMTASEIVSLMMALGLFVFAVKKSSCRDCTKAADILKMLRIALPDAVGTCARSILLTVEHLLIQRGLKLSGSSSSQALSAYGNVHAMALPVLLYPSAVLSSLSALLVPELATRLEFNDKASIERIVYKVIRLTLIFSIGTAGIMMCFARGFSYAVYSSNEATLYLRILAPLIPIMYLDMTVDGMLKGLDQQVYSMRYNIIDSALCVVLVIVLLPAFAVKGYIFILYISELINFFLSVNRLIKISRLRIEAADIIKPLICTTLACFATGFAAGSIENKAALILCVILTAGVYYLLLRLCGAIKALL